MQHYDYFLNPHISEPHYIARLGIIRDLSELAKETTGRVLDIGSGASRGYEKLFKPYVSEYLCLDRNPESNVDICSDCYNIPLDDNCIDVVLSTQVLEHLDNPSLMLKESYRVLKPGGTAIMTIPMSWGLHEEPDDFYRYTKYGIQYLLSEAGYVDIQIKPLEGLLASVIQLIIDEYYAIWLKSNKSAANHAVTILNKIALWLDKKFPTQRFCLTYLSTAHKPSN
ncbi:MAG: class I SAM-dependent methyltransferase [Calothrix sp. C42_A2020_038]|nr:class I SAM-dependent methyltransferase [Calothrix sp. C42_A2020_038]